MSVWMNGERVGAWSFSGAVHTFSYDAAWLANPLTRPLSLSLPLAYGTQPIRGAAVEAYFENLLPDSLTIRRRVAARFAAANIGAFDLLEKIGRDCVGAVQLLPADAPAPDVEQVRAQPLTEREIERLLDHTVAEGELGSPDEDDLRISIAGAQEKTALTWHQGRWCRPLGATPTTHILKLPMGEVGSMRADFSASVENEWLCAQLAERFGLPFARCDMERFGRHKVLVVERFDRRWMGSWWARLPQEDFCQVEGVPPERKYEDKGGPGMTAILSTLRASESAQADRLDFLSAQLLFWLLAAPDGHAKN
ncbi:MAG TPA: HipA domain-containing protein, partial [Burkholderiaceae bacterium]